MQSWDFLRSDRMQMLLLQLKIAKQCCDRELTAQDRRTWISWFTFLHKLDPDRIGFWELFLKNFIKLKKEQKSWEDL